jgi:8-oxo-dGTP diphosphatase
LENSERYKDINNCTRCGVKVDLVNDAEGKTRPICPECGWVYYKNPTPASACLVLNEDNEILIIKRKFEPNAGGWALPSGYVEIYQTPEECAIDELKEETGLIGEVTEFLGYYSDYSPVCERVFSFIFLMKATGGKLQAGDDALEALFIPINELPKIAFRSHRETIKLICHRLAQTKTGI